MVSLHTVVTSPALDPEAFIGALPLLLQRGRGLRFDDDGVAHFPAGRRSGLRLTGGAAGYAGARYHVVGSERTAEGDRPAEFDCEIRTDSADLAELEVTYPQGRARLAVDRPAFPQRLRVEADVEVGLPGMLGRHLTGTLTVRLADLWDIPGPQLAGHVELRVGRAEATAEVRPQPDERWRTALVLTGHPRGVGVLALVVWPFVRRRLRRALTHGLQQAMTDLAAEADELASGAVGPEEIADRAWAGLPDLLAR